MENGCPGSHQSFALHRQVVESVRTGQIEGDRQQLQAGPDFALSAQQVDAADEGVQRGPRHLPRRVVRRHGPVAVPDAAGHRSQRLKLDGAGPVDRGGAQRSLSRGQERVCGGGFAEDRQGAAQRGMFAGQQQRKDEPA